MRQARVGGEIEVTPETCAHVKQKGSVVRYAASSANPCGFCGRKDCATSWDYLGAVMYPGGSSVLGGYSDGSWGITNAGGDDFVVVKLDDDGSVS